MNTLNAQQRKIAMEHSICPNDCDTCAKSYIAREACREFREKEITQRMKPKRLPERN